MLTQVYSKDAIQDRIRDIAEDINRDFKDVKELHMIVTMNGTFMFAADLVRLVKVPLVLHFAGCDSYQNKEGKDIVINDDSLPPSFKNNPVILLEDVVDSGTTIGAIRQIIKDRGASIIRVAALLKRQGGVSADYYGFTIPQGLFVIGYGMDMDGKYRELPDLQSLGTVTSSGMC
jgi:hypoxanthine phosphoribosyltransferase